MLKQVLSVLCLGLGLVVYTSTASAQIYTWTDSKGVKHASDQPPPDVDVKTTVKGGGRIVPEAPASGSAPVAPVAASGPKTIKERELEFRQRQAAQNEASAKAQKEAQMKAERDAYCQALRSNLTMYESGGRVTRSNAKGEKEFLTDAQLAQEAEKARGQIARDCK